MKTLTTIAGFLLTMLVLTAPGSAQETGEANSEPVEVYVTTQDFSSLRTGPGLHFERLAVIDPAVTMRAVGRTPDTRWIQVEYNGQQGWVIYWLLVWSGDLVSLPVDGTNPQAFVRRAGVTGVTSRETPLYRREIAAHDLIGTLPANTPVEITGRLGNYYHFQIAYEGQLYWVSAFNVRITSGRYMRVLDTSYLYAYGRLVNNFDSDVASTSSALDRIEATWLNLEAGRRVSCDSATIPDYVTRKVRDVDVNQETVFSPPIIALDTAITHVNSAISMFSDACGRSEGNRYLTPEEVQAALDEVDSAWRNLLLADSLLESLRVRDPMVNPER